MRPRTVFACFGWAVVGAAIVAAQQKPPDLAPAGFKVTSSNFYGQAYIVDAEKANDACPKPHMDRGITFRASWTPNPMARQTVEMMAQAPEDAATDAYGIRDEPLGKERYRNGLLTWRKSTQPWIGIGKGPDLVMISGTWVGAGESRLFGVNIARYCGPKETVRGWIDGVIDKLTTTK